MDPDEQSYEGPAEVPRSRRRCGRGGRCPSADLDHHECRSCIHAECGGWFAPGASCDRSTHSAVHYSAVHYSADHPATGDSEADSEASVQAA